MMAAKSAVMQSSNSGEASPGFHWSRKVLLLLLLILAVALGLTILSRRNVNAPLLLFNVCADAAMGVAAGLGSRLVFRQRHWLLRSVAAALLCVLGLLVLGLLTKGISGIGPVRLHAVSIDWLGRLGIGVRPALPIGLGIDWRHALADIMIALGVSLLALRAWNGAYRLSLVQPGAAPGSGTRRVVQRARPALRPHSSGAVTADAMADRTHYAFPAKKEESSRRRGLGLPPALARLGRYPAGDIVRRRVAALGLTPALGGRRPEHRKRIAQRAGTVTINKYRSAAVTAPRSRKSVRRRAVVVRSRRGSVGAMSGPRNFFRRSRAVRLAAYEEHRCPYCLEPVRRGDARGTVECPICHTLHHKDCWDVTGTCQVPHLVS